MCVYVKLANFTIDPRFICKFKHELIPKAAQSKWIPTCEQYARLRDEKKFSAN